MRYVFLSILLLTLLAVSGRAYADPRTDCPDNNPCKVLLLNAQEEKILMDERGILATAAQARQLDLGGLVAYFQQKIAKAPAGDVPKVEAPKAPEKPTCVGGSCDSNNNGPAITVPK